MNKVFTSFPTFFFRYQTRETKSARIEIEGNNKRQDHSSLKENNFETVQIT